MQLEEGRLEEGDSRDRQCGSNTVKQDNQHTTAVRVNENTTMEEINRHVYDKWNIWLVAALRVHNPDAEGHMHNGATQRV